jgi:N-acetylglucosamine-6-sulfatase
MARGAVLAGSLGVTLVGIATLIGAGTWPSVERRQADSDPRGTGSRPNLLVVMTDDQTRTSFDASVMPQTLALFADGGTEFTQAVAAPPLCCPSRAGFLTGRYAHNTGVLDNHVGYGSLRYKSLTLATALEKAGYRTGLIGKFMNGYEVKAGTAPAPGFDYWHAIYGSADYFDFEVSHQGDVIPVSGYSTRKLTQEAVRFVGASRPAPFFLWLSYNAPHTVLPGAPGPCDGLAAQPPSRSAYRSFATSPLPAPGAFDERDVSDKPSLAGGPGLIKAGRLAEITQAWHCSLAAVHAVDTQLQKS